MYYLVDMFEGEILARADNVEDLATSPNLNMDELFATEDLDLVILKDTKYVPKLITRIKIQETY